MCFLSYYKYVLFLPIVVYVIKIVNKSPWKKTHCCNTCDIHPLHIFYYDYEIAQKHPLVVHILSKKCIVLKNNMIVFNFNYQCFHINEQRQSKFNIGYCGCM